MGDDEPPDDKAPDQAGGVPPRPADPFLDQAKAHLTEFFNRRPTETFYERQLAVMFEQRGRVNVVNVTPLDQRSPAEPGQLLDLGEGFYHWITTRALKSLEVEGRIAAETVPMGVVEEGEGAATSIKFYRHRTHRFWKRQANEILDLVRSL